MSLLRRPISHRLESHPRLPHPRAWWLSFWPRYGLAVVAVAVAALLRVILAPLVGREMPFLLQFCAVVGSAALGGLGPGLAATVLAALAVTMLSRVTEGAAPVASELRLFVLEGLVISLLGAWLWATRQRAQAADVANARLEKQMLDIGDNERRRFGHDLHDGLGQQLTGIALLSESLSHTLNQQAHPQAEHAGRVAELVSETIGWTRELARGLSPLTLETDGLAAAIEELTARTSKLFGISVGWDCEHAQLPVSDESALHIYRIVQEAISNSVKHGKAKVVQVRAAIENREVAVVIIDDGGGLSAKTVAQPGIGLRIMQYRAKLIGAKLTVVRARPEGGTIVRCTLPAAEVKPAAGVAAKEHTL